VARWTASAKWAAGPALDGQRDTPLGLGLNEGLGSTGQLRKRVLELVAVLPARDDDVELTCKSDKLTGSRVWDYRNR